MQTITIDDPSKELKNFTSQESRDTLRVDCSNTNSQYVAISVKNHELKNEQNQSQVLRSRDDQIPLAEIPKSPHQDHKKTMPKPTRMPPNSNVNSKPNSSHKIGRNHPKLNYDSTTRILLVADQENPSMKIRRLESK